MTLVCLSLQSSFPLPNNKVVHNRAHYLKEMVCNVFFDKWCNTRGRLLFTSFTNISLDLMKSTLSGSRKTFVDLWEQNFTVAQCTYADILCVNENAP